MSRNSVSVVIPVYHAELSLRILYEKLIPVLEGLTDRFEVVMVEDHSRDASWNIIQDLASRDQRVRGIRLSRNYGQHNALLCGIRAARYEVIVTMDDDLQHPTSEIKLLLDKLNEGHDVVYGVPREERHGFLRNVASQMTKIALQNVMGAETARHVSAFRVFRTKLREGFKDYRSSTVSIDVLLAWTTSSFSMVTVRHDSRFAGQSNYTLAKLVRHGLNLMTGFSVLPLQVASIIGFLFTLFGFLVLAWVLGRYLFADYSVAGFPFLASIIAIFSGAQLFALGIFGEYLARIHFRSMDRPAYVVEQTTKGED